MDIRLAKQEFNLLFEALEHYIETSESDFVSVQHFEMRDRLKLYNPEPINWRTFKLHENEK